jgi:hypothetical protein
MSESNLLTSEKVKTLAAYIDGTSDETAIQIYHSLFPEHYETGMRPNARTCRSRVNRYINMVMFAYAVPDYKRFLGAMR